MKIYWTGVLLLCIGSGLYAQKQGAESATPSRDIHTSSIYYAKTGRLQEKYQYYFDHWSGQTVREGRFSQWDKSGKLRYDAWYRAGRLDSLATFYAPDGTIRKQEQWVAGRLQGHSLTYYPNGTVKKRIPYHQGLRQGLAKCYYSNGQLREVCTWKNDRRDGMRQRYRPSGERKSETEFREGLRFRPEKKKNENPAPAPDTP